MELNANLTTIKGVGPQVYQLFEKLGLRTVNDLLDFYPRHYEDYSNIQIIATLKPGKVSIRAQIKQAKGRYVQGGLHVTEAVASDDSGSVRLVWFNQPYRAQSLKAGEFYLISGLFELRKGHLSLTNPSIELESTFPVNTARVLPIYPETKGLTSRQIRKVVAAIYQGSIELSETLPAGVLQEHDLISYDQAVRLKHLPSSPADIEAADRRLGFEELFEIILASSYTRQLIENEHSLQIPFKESIAKQFTRHLPFTLTDAQKKTIWQVYQDMAEADPMNRLVEGDVGSGKTVVAVMAAIMAIEAGYQVAFMAPTELLARQHADTIYQLLEPLGIADRAVLLVGGMATDQKNKAREAIKSGQAAFMIGTHALIQDTVDMHKLALVVIDEQHRFGVKQRKELLKKAGRAPHMLSMTATPIPRSLALTVFGDMDISILDQKPKNRLPIITKLVNPTERDRLYEQIDVQLDQGRQVFIVCPLIEESDALKLRSAEATYKQIQARFKRRSVGLLHGKLKSDLKQSVMQDFASGAIDILVATTVVEVGVDVPNASIMLIEAPERFGLAQLHQLRGRVGRSGEQGYCYLMLSDSTPPTRRLKAIEASQDGFKLAELDLEIRGAGALYGTMQHGQLDLRIANFTDTRLIAEARAAAKSFLADPNNLVQYPHIKQRILELQTVVHLN